MGLRVLEAWFPVMTDLMEALQWPAMITTIAAAWLVGSSSIRRRRAGFWLFLCSNVLWVGWGWKEYSKWSRQSVTSPGRPS